MSFEKRIDFNPERSIAFGSIGAAYTPITPSFEQATRLLRISNETDVPLYFSFEGTMDQLSLPSGGSIVLTTQQFSSTQVEASFRTDTTLYVKRLAGAPTLGTVFVNTGFVS